MSTGTTRRILYGAVAVFIASAIVTLVQHRQFEIPILMAHGAQVAVGGLIMVRRPGNTIGLALVAAGAIWGVMGALIITAESLDEAGHLGAAAWATLLAAVPAPLMIWVIGAIWLLFPDGRPNSPRDRTLLLGSGVLAVLLTFVAVIGTPQALPESKA